MNLLLLPGNSAQHKQWLEQVEYHLSPLFTQTICHNYRHWQTGSPEIDLAYETSQLIDYTYDFAPYIVFAKSAGIVLCLQAIQQGILQPSACLFTGLPLPMIESYGLPLKNWLQTSTVPTRIIQNDSDPHGSYNHVASLVDDCHNPLITAHKSAGNTHDYNDFDLLFRETQALIQKAT